MNCAKCQDRGFIEENHGLIVILCDCEKGKEYRARQEAILGIPAENGDDLEHSNDSGTESDNTNLRGDNPSQSSKPSKPKKKKKPRKRTK